MVHDKYILGFQTGKNDSKADAERLNTSSVPRQYSGNFSENQIPAGLTQRRRRPEQTLHESCES